MYIYILYYNSVRYDYHSLNLLLRDNVCDVKQDCIDC